MLVLKRIRQCEAVLREYPGSTPFTPVLKDFFRRHSNMGARDRREVTAMSYALLRTGLLRKFFSSFEEHAAWAVFLCLSHQGDWLKQLVSAGLLPVDATGTGRVEDSLSFFLQQYKNIHREDLFPVSGQVSSLINRHLFYASHLQQPFFWFRVKERKRENFIKKLDEAAVPYRQQGNAFGLPNGFELPKLLGAGTNIWGEIQDLSSQQATLLPELEGHEKVWDVCAASGGKSLALSDRYPRLSLYASDIRASVLNNLCQRFVASGQALPYLAVADLSLPVGQVLFENRTDRVKAEKDYFNVLVLDVPCTGSGTWGRNPEFLPDFDEKKISVYRQLQRDILSNSSYFLRKGGQVLYITCSVFCAENEENVRFAESLGLEIVCQQYFEGYKNRADTLFAALLRKA
jgi:16S rRNA (cytosine967-C5)-methyltransferase